MDLSNSQWVRKSEWLLWLSEVFSLFEAESPPVNANYTFSPMFLSCKSSINYMVECSCVPWQVSFTFKNLPETWSMNPNLNGFKLINPREVKRLFTCLQACWEAALLIPCLTNKESWLANPNRAVMLSKRYNSPWGNLKWVGEMLRIEESC